MTSFLNTVIKFFCGVLLCFGNDDNNKQKCLNTANMHVLLLPERKLLQPIKWSMFGQRANTATYLFPDCACTIEVSSVWAVIEICFGDGGIFRCHFVALLYQLHPFSLISDQYGCTKSVCVCRKVNLESVCLLSYFIIRFNYLQKIIIIVTL